MLHSLILSIEQLRDRRILIVFVKSIVLALVLLAALAVGAVFGARWLVEGWLNAGSTLGRLAGGIALLASLAGGWLAFRVVAVATLGIFADDVVAAVEARHYPLALEKVRPVPLSRSIAMGLGAAGRALLVNVLMLPLYLGLLFTGIGAAIVFFVVNSWLLGRDLGDMVAARHLDTRALKAWRSDTRIGRLALGAIGIGLLMVPVLNLVAPVIGAAMATHLFHRRTAHDPPAPPDHPAGRAGGLYADPRRD